MLFAVVSRGLKKKERKERLCTAIDSFAQLETV